MSAEQMRVRMLGNFSIEWNGASVNDNENRSKKVWLLLAYMVYCRNRPVSQEELTALLWGEEETSSNPLNALKTMFHRVRTMLNKLGGSMGHDLIVRRGGSYAWNTDIPMHYDVEEFEELCRIGLSTQNEEERLDCCLRAVELYQGDFLYKLAAEPWVVPISVYFHNLYIQAVQSAVELLEARQRRQEAIDLCRRALKVEPYSEELYNHLIRNLLDLEDRKGAIAAYDEMSQLLFDNFGIMPSDEIRAMYREAVRTVNDRSVAPGVVRDQLREIEPPDGALICDYDFFKVLYHAEARFISRSGDAIHIGLISVTGEDNTELPKRSLDRAMENLLEQIRLNLRRGDIAARCSVSQYILLLPQANYENSCKVCERVIRSFFRQYPHSPAKVTYSVQPMEPTT